MGASVTDKLVITRVLGIPITIKYKDEEELGRGSMLLFAFTVALFFPISIILNHQYNVISTALFIKPFVIPSFFFYIIVWALDSLLGTGLLVLLFVTQLIVLILTCF